MIIIATVVATAAVLAGSTLLLAAAFHAGIRRGGTDTLNEIRWAVHLAGLPVTITGGRLESGN